LNEWGVFLSNQQWFLSCLSEEEKTPTNEAVAEYLEGRKKYEGLRKQKLKKGTREEQVNKKNSACGRYLLKFGHFCSWIWDSVIK